MTGRFETLVYTDCRPGQGLKGGAGLQFQARSSDEAAAGEDLVRNNLLYEPPSPWMADRRPVAQYPPSFAHIRSGGLLATASGVYLGREANGTREGNQLTHAIVTTDPASYDDLRPAQLFRAPFWSTELAPTTRSAPVELTDGVGAALSPAHARDFVLAQPDGPVTLLALVCALGEAGQPGRRRVLFVGDDAASVVSWIVAGTLLVPRERALELGFKVFSTDPARSALPIVAVLPEFAGSAGRVDNELGYVVFDLCRHAHTPVAPTAAARRWVDLFLTEDPRDVVDALHVATESGITGGGGQPDEAAAALGLAAILHRRPDPRHAEAIVGWLRTGPAGMRRAYGVDVADLFAETPERWPQEVLVLLDEVGCDGLVPGRAAEVRLALMISEVEAARTRGVVTDRPLPALPNGEWNADHDDQARQILTEALTSGVPPLRFAALLRVATRFRVDVRWDDIQDAAEPFVGYWADHPRAVRPRGWPCAGMLHDRLIALLGERALLGEAAQAEIGDTWREPLLPHVGTLPPQLAEAVLGATVRRGENRATVVERHLREARHDPGWFSWTVGALWGQAPPTTAELELVRDLAPAGARPGAWVFRRLVAQVTGSAPPTPRLLDLCRALLAQGLMTATPQVRGELEDDDTLTAVVAELRRVPDGERAATLLRRLRGCSPRLVEMRQADVASVLARLVAFQPLDAVLDRHPTLLVPLVTRLAETLHHEDAVPPAVLSYYLLAGAGPPAAPQATLLERALGHWLTRAQDEQIERAGRHFGQLDSAWRDGWQRHAEAYRHRRRRYRLTHPFGRR
ncbi:GTPase-associated protein 1-related protein [Micromonospora sp. NBC_01655]|uniref:GTPase-associated protein 1-related protein n=1 Tax=Micromonospora sp. NBC_01655 TaxID=2975983 RepID=UPI0022526E9C|nr:GTPase-associated protein 1-related protein [Micromonospora sp. NBC_01655]MCX4473568.1 GTPase-associated protein 1-related protein [Micromonospora sp. NBC_01655]